MNTPLNFIKTSLKDSGIDLTGSENFNSPLQYLALHELNLPAEKAEKIDAWIKFIAIKELKLPFEQAVLMENYHQYHCIQEKISPLEECLGLTAENIKESSLLQQKQLEQLNNDAFWACINTAIMLPTSVLITTMIYLFREPLYLIVIHLPEIIGIPILYDSILPYLPLANAQEIELLGDCSVTEFDTDLVC